LERIGVLTSGGDAPGMNSAIRSIVKTAQKNKIQVYGIEFGYIGLLEMKYKKLNILDIDHISTDGGTILKSGRTDRFKTDEGIEQAVKNIKKMKLDGLIVIGGDGSIKGAQKLAKKEIKVIAIPGTIDNDINVTDYTIGFDTACNIVINSVDKVLDTAKSLVNENPRIFLIEVMGRNSGDIALYSSLSGGADEVLIPEQKIDYNEIINNLNNKFKIGKKYAIIIMAEGAGKLDEVKNKLEKDLGYSIKSILLGHLQRGGNPSAFDRILASKFGYYAVQTMINKNQCGIIGINCNDIILNKFNNSKKTKSKTDNEIYELSKTLCH
jgi:6-phosphofructokinase 1